MSREVRRAYVSGGKTRVVRLHHDGRSVRGQIDDREVGTDAHVVRHLPGGAELFLGADADAERAVVVRDGDTVFVAFRGRVHRLAVATAHGGAGDAHDAADDDFAESPMTGVVLKVAATAGAEYTAGQPLFVVEAMKMEFVVEAPRDLRVAEVNVSEGDRVDIGQVLATFAPEEEQA